MAENFRRREEDKEHVKRFEEHLKNKSNYFFELEAYENIIQYYIDHAKFPKALKACEIAIEQYPFSIELMLDKAQVLSNLYQHDEALEIIEKAGNLQPNDPEILLLKGNILSLMGKFKEAIKEFENSLLFAEDKDEIY